MQVRYNKYELFDVMGVKGEGNKSQVDKYMAINNTQWLPITIACSSAGINIYGDNMR